MRSYSSKTGRGTSTSRKGKKTGDPLLPSISLDTWLDILGSVLIGLAALTLFGLLSTQRSALVGGWVAFTSRLFGWGVYLAPMVLGAVGLYLLIRRFGERFPRLLPARIGGAVFAYLSALAVVHGLAMLIANQEGRALAANGQAGGEVGWAILALLIGLLGNAGAGLVLLPALVAGVMLALGVSADQVLRAFQRLRARPDAPPADAPRDDIIEPKRSGLIIRGLKSRRPSRRPTDERMPIGEATPPAGGRVPAGDEQPVMQPQPARNRSGPLPPPRIIGTLSGEPIRPRTTQNGPTQAPPSAPATPPSMAGISSIYQRPRAWQMPRIEGLLAPGSDASAKEGEIRQRAALIEQTLLAFGVPGRVVEVNRGPTITQFGIEPGFNETKGGKQTKVKVSRIAALADDLALALAVPRVRIEAPIPGRALVGVEVPNSEASLVALRDVMESEEFEALRRKTRLALALGQDVSGRPVVADLTSMPHLLIAGTTGSGKSVCVNAILVALLCTNAPDDLRLLLIDPKRVELIGYNGIPHLISPVVVDLEKATQALQWVTREMDGRYRLFARYGARNIAEFNAKVEAGAAEGPQKLPYIVVVIDELADLMMTAPDETEKVICRLAQMARATGIHLILATQRPSVDVVTGLIKANFPARIAFTVATSVDSRVILDGPGAEKLLGRGDMLFVTPEQPLPARAQGCYISGSEIERVVRHWRAQLADQPISAPKLEEESSGQGATDEASWTAMPTSGLFSGPPTWEEARATSQAAGEDSRGDRLFHDAVATVRMHGKASISLLQRRLRIGYTRAARLIEEMEARGIVGPAVPGQQYREVLNAPINKDEDAR
jgi:S-DNA-T family DNA segregation ATPase FtsK/SpoIIIE